MFNFQAQKKGKKDDAYEVFQELTIQDLPASASYSQVAQCDGCPLNSQGAVQINPDIYCKVSLLRHGTTEDSAKKF